MADNFRWKAVAFEGELAHRASLISAARSHHPGLCDKAGLSGLAVTRGEAAIPELDFPLSRSLPPLLSTDGWIWHPPSDRLCFWVGEDADGTHWLVKCRGGFSTRAIPCTRRCLIAVTVFD